jgi:5-methyltetrahydropteroyltriglutamate--homocysteine methyltransferase
MLIARDAGADAAGIEDRIKGAVEDVVRQQKEIGIDVVNDGEMGKIGFAMYTKDRLSGFDGQSSWVGEERPEMRDHPDFAERWRAATNQGIMTNPACSGEITVKDHEAIRLDIANMRAAAGAAGVALDNVFMSAASPGVIAHFFANQYYPTREAYIGALADAMRHEYEAIVDAGMILQVDCPDLAMSKHSVFANMTVPEFRKVAGLSVEALNHAVARIPSDRMRMHICWGNYEGPHNHDLELKDIVDVVLQARPAGLVIEGSNPRHGHEWRVWEDVKLPDDRYIVAGVIDTTTNFVEHPELVAQRLLNFARLVGPERVMGGSDCGFGTIATMATVTPTVTWSKLRSLTQGAEFASRALSAD